MQVIVVMPVFNDWESAAMLCAAIGSQTTESISPEVAIVIVDDGSHISTPEKFPGQISNAVSTISVLKLRRNLGHQRAIAVALAYVQQKLSADAVVVMDADGEDRPEDIQRLVAAFQGANSTVTVFAERGRRVESFAFKIFYGFYRLLHRLLTGRNIRFGNFSLLPRAHLDSIVAYPELWNHYAAAVLKARLPHMAIRADRGKRFFGNSKMSFVGLVVHGLSALFASYEIVSTRLLVAGAGLCFAFFVLLLAVVFVRFSTHLAIPGWATYTIGLLFVLMSQSIAALLTIVFSVMISRNNLGFLPIRDYEHFVSDFVELPLL